MASTGIIFNSALYDEAKGSIDYDTDSFKVMLLNTTLTLATIKDSWTKRSDVTGETTGTGYTAGGAAVTVTVGSIDTANDRVDITLGGNTWTTATVSATHAVYYKSRGGASSADELVAIIDFQATVTATAGDFVLNSSTLRKQNS